MESNILVLVRCNHHVEHPSKEVCKKVVEYYSSVNKIDYKERNRGEFEVMTIKNGAMEENIFLSLFYSGNSPLIEKIEKIFNQKFFKFLDMDFLEVLTKDVSVEEFIEKLQTEFELVLFEDDGPP